jgi:hypothetical protein
MKKPFTEKNYGLNLDGLKRCIEDNKLKSKILFSNPYGAIVHVVSYDESVILGAESTWCISQHNVSWEQYVVKPNGIQLFFYCFQSPVNSDYSLYGATFKIKDNEIETMCCFTRENNPIGKARGYDTDEEALMNTVVGNIFGDIFNQLAEKIYNIGKSTKEGKNKEPIQQSESDKIDLTSLSTYIPAQSNCYFREYDFFEDDDWMFDDWR